MIKTLFSILLLVFFILPTKTLAQNQSFVSVVNPVRGEEFWEEKSQTPQTAVLGQLEILNKLNVSATWLLRFDVLGDESITQKLKSENDEKGLFLEVTPSWAKEAGIEYRASQNWHNAGSAFLTGYEQNEREKLIDAAFLKFKDVFGFIPTSVGAWWIDSYSLSYMQKKYGVTAGLIVADQYTTDNYQVWGQYWSTPYYPSLRNALHPAQNIEDKIPLVLTQWASRDPINGYGNGVFESTFSVQPNDYIDFHNLDINYFSKLVDIYTKQSLNSFGQVVVGLENTYSWEKYKDEYKRQIETLVEKQRKDNLNIVTLKDFSSWYSNAFPKLSSEHIIVADDPLGSSRKAVWFMNVYYRAGWFFNEDGSVFRDIRPYAGSTEELCYQKRCDEVNFATSATRVLDEVTFGHKYIIDPGKISDFEVLKQGENFLISYQNEAGNIRSIGFLLRDIAIDGRKSSIDGMILDATEQSQAQLKKNEFTEGSFSWTIGGVLLKVAKILLFSFFAIFIPGTIIVSRLRKNAGVSLYLSIVTGLVSLTLIFYITSILNLKYLIFVYLALNIFLAVRLKIFPISLKLPVLDKLNWLTILTITSGTIFQNIPMFKNGLIFPFGMGFWGPNTHDGIWHISLINQLIKEVPPQNPIFADTVLKNYHFFYDLLVASTSYLTKIPVIDLIFRFYPILFSLLLGLGTYYFARNLFKNRVSAILSIYFVYFAGSFGWILEYFRNKNLGGESAFWANQSISFNLNPPFAISLLIIIAFLLLIADKGFKSLHGIFIAILLVGSLVGFKAYAAVLILGALFFVALSNMFKKDFSYFYIFLFSSIFALVVFLLNFQPSQQLMIFSPFWFIHSMIDSPDRVGWVRLSIARIAGLETGNWFKFITAEIVGLLIFIVGNLGMRILSLASLTKIKTIFKDNYLSLILIFSLMSILIPILFIQSGNPWNTIQFSYYALYITAVVSGGVLSLLIFKLPKTLSIILLFGVLILTPVNSITTATYYMGFLPHGRIDNKELEALDFLKNQKEGTVVTYPYDQRLRKKVAEPWPLFVYDSTAYVAALSEKEVYLEDEPQNQILLTEYKKRLVASKDFFLRGDSKFLKEENISYIYLPTLLNIKLDEALGIEKIFENEQSIIYRTK